ncbi:MAG: beta-lactamase family protein [Chloroflexi bacterium]|nr:beta-lactamase family protein [Chloroflexota bacterium]
MNSVLPETQGFASQRLARIDAVLDAYVAEEKIAGVVSLVARNGQIVHLHHAGMAVRESNTPMQADTIFRIYSMTKPITSVAVLMLMEEGRLRLSDPVAAYLPAFQNVKVLDTSLDTGVRSVTPARPPTVHDLLTHTAGLSYGFDAAVYIDQLYQQRVWEPWRQNPAALSLNGLMEILASLPLAHHPGSKYRYSMATDVLGGIVQAVAGEPFDHFLHERILQPLGMVDTAFYVPAEKCGRFAATYGPGEQGGLKLLDGTQTGHYLQPATCPFGGSGLVSTAGDYLRFAQMLLNRGELDGVRLLGRKTVELMTTNGLPPGLHPFDDSASGFGLGVSVLMDLGRSAALGSVGNYGWGGAANTNFWVDPQEQIVGLLMLQYMPSDTYPVVADFRNQVYQALVG